MKNNRSFILLLIFLHLTAFVFAAFAAEDVKVSLITLYDEDGEEHTFHSVRDKKFGKDVFLKINTTEPYSQSMNETPSLDLTTAPQITIDYKKLKEDLSVEPSVNDVQKMAIEYANVNPHQIKRWHNQARAKAFLPSLSVGFARADTELYHWDTGGNPDVLSKGRDYLDWSTTVSWDFSDLVWSSDRTSIDSRAKSMSELRQDILDQVTSLYFERRRIQAELASLTESDPGREIRIEELTALIDGLTGGEFSRRVSKDSPVRKK